MPVILHCPTCGAEHNGFEGVMMVAGCLLITQEGEFAKLGPIESGIIRELVKSKIPLSRDQLIDRVYFSNPPVDQTTMTVIISHLNQQKLCHVGLRILNLAGKGVRDARYSLVKA